VVGLLGRGISPSQGHYLHRTAQHRKTRTHIHGSSGIRTNDPSVRAGEDRTCLRLRSHWDRQSLIFRYIFTAQKSVSYKRVRRYRDLHFFILRLLFVRLVIFEKTVEFRFELHVKLRVYRADKNQNEISPTIYTIHCQYLILSRSANYDLDMENISTRSPHYALNLFLLQVQ
jgi:hypothetical protein